MDTIVFDDFTTFVRDRHVDAQSSPHARLAPTLLLTREMGVNGDIPEALSDTSWARITFDLPAAVTQDAELLFYVNADTSTQQNPMHLRVNGHQIEHHQNREAMLTGGWDRCRIPATSLRQGNNEFVFHGNGVLHVDPFPGGLPDPPRSHSTRSFDGGATWHPGTHGPDGNLHGEYMVRLRLHGYAPGGLLTSSVIDLADPQDEGVIAAAPAFSRAELNAQVETPGGTAIEFRLRTGSTPGFDPRTWTPWMSCTRLDNPRRFVQWQARLSTTSATTTPVLNSVALQIESSGQDKAQTAAQLLELDQPLLIRSSYPFTCLAPDHRQERLRQEYRLDQVVAAGKTELEQLALLRDWVHSQWLGWQSGKYPYCPPWDPLEILSTTKGNWGFGMCTHYGATFAGCAAALGFVSRSIVVDHHCLAEVWSEDLQKWILEDAGPSREYDATYELDGTPLNALELHALLQRGKQDKVMANKLPQGQTEPMSDHVKSFVRFGIPLRNNHLIHPEPAELRHGYGQYHWDGYLWWSDAIEPRYPEYSLQTSRPADFYWSVNQTRVYLQATDAPDCLQLLLDHTMPNFSHFLVRCNGGDWETQAGPTLEWPLQPGDNSVEVRAVNTFGRMGRIARARVRHGA